MSRNAKRLTSEVATNRFEWPRPEAIGRGVQPGIKPPIQPIVPPRTPVQPREMPLPPPVAERVAALEREAFEKGRLEGERAGESAALARTDDLLRRLSATIDEIASLRVGMMRKTERELVRLAVAMAERIVRKEVQIDRELLAKMAHVAIERLGESVVATIHLNPVDHEALSARRDASLGQAVQLVADPAVEPGGCLVRSAFGVIDAGIDTQVREVARALLGDDASEEAGSDGDPSGA
jgi:flagellar assembly protein FliH